MAVIGKIREKSTLLLIVVGGALMAFVLTDLFSSRSSVFGNDLQNIGTIDGNEIRGVDFDNKYQVELDNYKKRQNTTEIPEFVRTQIRDQVWNSYIDEFILGSELEALGLTVSTDELADMTYGDNPHAQVLQAFSNPETGEFDKNNVIAFLKRLDQDEETKNQWNIFEKAIKKQRNEEKYYAMISKGVYTTRLEAEDYYKSQNKRMNISFVAKRYRDLPDSSVKVTDADIKKYYNANQNKFEEKKSRRVAYAIFDIVASSADSADIKEWVDETYEDFKNTEDDSSFVNRNSDDEFDFKFYSATEENEFIDSSYYSFEEAGVTFDPVIENGRWVMKKIAKIKFSADSVEARHILIAFNKDNKEDVRAQVDSIIGAIKGGADFGQLAAQYSIDPGSKDKNGELGWFEEGYMLPAINDSSFFGDLNKLMVVETIYGFHILEVTNRSETVKKIQMATVVRSIDPSKETASIQFSRSNDFSYKLSEGDTELEKLAEEFGVRFSSIDVRENDNTVPEIESSRGLIRWAYNTETKLGQVSDPQQYGGSFVVAELREIHEDGVAPLESVRDEAEIGAIKDKKAEKFIEEMSGFTSLDDASSNLSLPVEKAEGVIFESYSVPILGREPEVLGRVYTMNEGDLSIPIKGQNGVFIIQVDKVEDALPNDDLSAPAFQLTQSRSSRANFEVMEALKERVDIVDNRHLLY